MRRPVSCPSATLTVEFRTRECTLPAGILKPQWTQCSPARGCIIRATTASIPSNMDGQRNASRAPDVVTKAPDVSALARCQWCNGASGLVHHGPCSMRIGQAAPQMQRLTHVEEFRWIRSYVDALRVQLGRW